MPNVILVKLSKMWAWIKKRKKIISITLLVSLVGGVPGIINIIKWSTDSPKFGFYPQATTSGYIMVQKNQRNFIFVVGAIYNDGAEPLFPVEFTLKVKFNKGDSIMTLYSTDTPDTLIKGNKQFKFHDQITDILKILKINSKDAEWGCLFFPTFDNIYQWDDIQYFKLTCIDLLGRERSVQFKMGMQAGKNKYYYLPKSGMELNN